MTSVIYLSEITTKVAIRYHRLIMLRIGKAFLVYGKWEDQKLTEKKRKLYSSLLILYVMEEYLRYWYRIY